MTNIGYARVSTTDQNLEIQIAALKAAGCDVIRSEKRSGTSTTDRAELQTVLDFLRKGDCLMVTRIDRLARSIGDLQDIVRAVKAKGASLKATEQPIDTTGAAGKAFLTLTLGWSLGLCLAAPYLLPWWEYARTSARVEQRTAELAGANVELRSQIAERQHAEEALQNAQTALAHVTRVTFAAVESARTGLPVQV